MMINDRIREQINQGASTEKIRDVALQTGMRPLRVAGMEKVYGGVTTLEEVIRETVHD